jgi:hypothetical protein
MVVLTQAEVYNMACLLANRASGRAICGNRRDDNGAFPLSA